MASRNSAAAAASGGQSSAPAIVVAYPFVPETSSEFSFAHFEEYQGIIKIRRLQYLAERCPGASVPAFREALKTVKSGVALTSYSSNVIGTSSTVPTTTPLGPSPPLYYEVLSRARELLLTPSNQPEHQYFLSAGAAAKVAADPLFAVDQVFQNNSTKSFNEVQRDLENQLTIQKRDGEREQIKVASLNLAEFYLNRGDLNAALNKYLESKEFVAQSNSVATNWELLNIALNIIKVSVLMLNMSHVKTQVQRAQRLIKEISTAGGAAQSEKDEKDARIINSKLNAAMGLFHMKGNAYHSAAQSFVAVSSDLQGQYNDVCSGFDVATYGAICALASFSRKELKEVLNNTEFKKLLDTNTPTTWKQILQQFYNSNYARVFELLEKIKSDLYLDVFLSQHVNRLIKQIRERAFIQYFKAYVSVELSVMSVAFNLDMPSLERTLAELIQENKIAARIDSHKKILYARHADQRNDTFTQALALGARYTRDVRSLIMRLSLVEHDVSVRSAESKSRKAKQGERGGIMADFDEMMGGGGGREAAMMGGMGMRPEDFMRQQQAAMMHATQRR